MFIDFLHHFVFDHINCYYFRLMTYSIGENQSCEAKVRLDNQNPGRTRCHIAGEPISCVGQKRIFFFALESFVY